MNEYNERILKTVLQDLRAEKDDELLKEIEIANNDPFFQVSDEEAEEFAKKFVKKKQKKNKKLHLKVASVIFAMVITCASFIPITVEGKKDSIAQHLIYYIGSDSLSFATNDINKIARSYEGQFKPSYIPEGYYVEDISNSKNYNYIVIRKDDEKLIMILEESSNATIGNDYEPGTEITEINVLGFNGIYYVQDNVQYIVLYTDDVILSITCNDEEVDLLSFAEKLEIK